MRTTLGRLWHICFLFPLVASAIILIAFVTYSLVWPLEPIHSVRMKILNDQATPGDPIRFQAYVCKEVDTASELHYGLTDINTGRYFYAGMEYGINPKGCFEVVQHFHLPIDIPVGEYQVDVLGEIGVNALRTERYRLPMGILKVKEAE